ncbi:MAG: secondary thiamine-phosphate synthase enzyme YjbQ [Candidatus Goldbacteria bacterium]|nr:secondary thiamine-phosphate synthase enzyme YjbQ [Candidatus Goldiibacteriota bacterium]
MIIKMERISFSTKGFNEIKDITDRVAELIEESDVKNGIVALFVPGSTGGLTTIEYESGLISDFPDLMEKLIPYKAHYEHNATWGDANGASHLRASLIGPSLTIPFKDKKMTLGTWQQIIFIDFDTHSRNRSIVVQIMGE